jgi:hypothetical protein
MHDEVHGNNAARSVNTNPLVAALEEVPPDELKAAVRGACALLASCVALTDPASPASLILQRIGLLANAKWLPDSGTGNVSALQFLMACSDDYVRDAAKRTAAPRYEPTGRGSSMWRPGEIARNAIVRPDPPVEGEIGPDESGPLPK